MATLATTAPLGRETERSLAAAAAALVAFVFVAPFVL
jgi:hypothetical protein